MGVTGEGRRGKKKGGDWRKISGAINKKTKMIVNLSQHNYKEKGSVKTNMGHMTRKSSVIFTTC